MVCLRVCDSLAAEQALSHFLCLAQDHRCCMPYTPICIAKAVKNSAESDGMRRAHVSRVAGVGDKVGGGQKDPALSSSPALALGLRPLVFQSQWENEMIMLGM